QLTHRPPSLDNPHRARDDTGEKGAPATGLTTASISLLALAAQAPFVASFAEAESAPEVFRRVSPSVVLIVTVDRDGGSLGSGVVLTTEGLVATNHHVIKGAQQIGIRLESGKLVTPVVVVRDDPARDLAILFVPGLNIRPPTLGDSNAGEVGEDVLAIGN